jgi:hypothetical protein
VFAKKHSLDFLQQNKKRCYEMYVCNKVVCVIANSAYMWQQEDCEKYRKKEDIPVAVWVTFVAFLLRPLEACLAAATSARSLFMLLTHS